MEKSKFSLNYFFLVVSIFLSMAIVFLSTNYFSREDGIEATLQNNRWEIKRGSYIKIVEMVTFSDEEINVRATNLDPAFSGTRTYQYSIDEDRITIDSYDGEEIYLIEENEDGFKFIAQNDLAKANQGNVQLMKK
ncbi:hypothetical protein [uncultured Enterococcus sp.]|uniref:hypothetical protein n=1 Tax=uncultured Enterococcus sp. TaxID=167972 RepID=UPI002AA7F6E2|nr:hypothetical protein [uncultured Enterococcus sp.]